MLPQHRCGPAVTQSISDQSEPSLAPPSNSLLWLQRTRAWTQRGSEFSFFFLLSCCCSCCCWTMDRGEVLAVWLLCWSCSVSLVTSIHRTDMFPYGSLSGDLILAEGDDETSRVLTLPRPLYFYNSAFTQLYVSTDLSQDPNTFTLTHTVWQRNQGRIP